MIGRSLEVRRRCKTANVLETANVLKARVRILKAEGPKVRTPKARPLEVEIRSFELWAREGRVNRDGEGSEYTGTCIE